MSRCFPFPPPGYLSNGVRGEAVRDPIKLPKGTEKPITDHDSKKRRDRKERKEKKDKKRSDKGKKENVYKVDTHKNSEKSLLPKGKEEEAERSDLTEEHEQPVSTLNVCHSPDSSGRGNKRKLDNSGSISKAHGNVLRIRLPLQRHREPDSSIGVERLSSDAGNAVSLSHIVATSTAQCLDESHPVTSNSGIASKSVKDSCDADLKVKDSKPGSLSVPKRKEHKAESLYKSLIEDWIPPPLEMEQTVYDDSWLYQSKEQDDLRCKRFKQSHDGKQCHESSNLWPCARYLAEADVYALPYSVPF